MPSRDLPTNVKSIVAEIETEIGEEDAAPAFAAALVPAAAIEGAGAHDALTTMGNGRVEAAVRGILREIGEDPDRQGLLGTPERVTQQVADFLQARLGPSGTGVVIEATHLCAVMRGVRKPGTVMTTSHVLGLFRTNDKTRAEFFAHLARRAPGA